MRELALPLSIFVLAGVLALDHLPTAHAQGAGATCTLIDRKVQPGKILDAVQEGMAVHAGREAVVLPIPGTGPTSDWIVCSWED